MKIALSSLATVLLACSTSSSPDATPEVSSTTVSSSAEALRKLGQVDADDVQKCRAAAQRCEDGPDAAANPFCERIDQHCDDLEEQLAADRAELAQCLAEAAACEENAADPAECAAARAACEPADGEFRARRGRTRQCAERAERCLSEGGPGARFGFGRGAARDDDRADAGDAGANVCTPDDTDFVGCCSGRHERGDAGAQGFGGFGRGGRAGFPGRGPRPDRDRDAADAGADAGASARGFGPPGAPFRRAP